MQEYIIITRPAEKESESTIKLMDGKILQAGLKKDIESLESYLIHLNWVEMFERDSHQPLKNHYYFIDGAIRIRRYPEDQNLEIFPLKPHTNTQGSVFYRTKAADILFQFDKKIKQLFPEAEHTLKIRHIACCMLQPRIKFNEEGLKKIRNTFPEFPAPENVDETEYKPQIIPPEINYEEEYENDHCGYYDCKRCDPDPCWGRYTEIRPEEEDAHEEFYEQKVPKRSRGSPRAYCLGTRTRCRPPMDKETIELGYWKLSSEELLSRIKNPEKDDVLDSLLEERSWRVLDGKITLSIKPINLCEFDELLASEEWPYAKLQRLEEKGLIKEYHAKEEDS